MGSPESMDIFVDVDGTLTVETLGWGNDVFFARTPRPEIIEKVNAMYNSGHNIVIWTARRLEDKEVTERWLLKHGVKYHRAKYDKPMWDWYICDKSINVEDLDELDI